jgi:hypothetical protein
MTMAWSVVTRPDELVPSLEEVKGGLRVDQSYSDDDLLSKIWGAITEFEDPRLGWLGTSVLARQIEVRLPSFPSCIELPLGPVLVNDLYEFVITYDDVDGIEQELSDVVYRIADPDTSCRRVVLKSGQARPQVQAGDSSVRVKYWCGYDADDTRINNFKSAVKFHVEMTYDGATEANRNLPDTIRRLLQPYQSMFV